MSHKANQKVRIANDLGVHLRAAGALVQVASRFEAEIWLARRGNRANAKSIMSVLSLAAAKGAEIEILAEGDDAVAAVAAIVTLVENGFGIT